MTVSINGTSGLVFSDGSSQASGGYTGFRNRIINGDMKIDQRNAGAAVTGNDSFPVDRFRLSYGNSSGAFSAQQSTTAPAGFVNSLKYTTTTADASLGATEYAQLYHVVEGLNVADLGWGTANAQPVTLSFWCRSSVTGTFGGAIRNSAGNRSYPFSYTISVADTWEYKSIAIAGDTSGTWLTTNGVGMYVNIGMGVGSTLSGTAGSWAAANYIGATGAVNLIATLNATFYITGVQLEKGSSATPFEVRPYGTELQLCQRYYVSWGGDNHAFEKITLGGLWNTTTSANMFVQTPVDLRNPSGVSIGYSSLSDFLAVWGGGFSVPSSVTLDMSGKRVVALSTFVASGPVAGQAAYLSAQSLSARFYVSNEL